MDTKGQMGVLAKTQTEKRGRVEFLDVARGMTMLMIVVFHVLGETSLIYHRFVVTMGLQVFLFVSGYFFRGFSLKKNLEKLVLPYVLLLVAVCVYWDVMLRTAWPGQILDIIKQTLLGYTVDAMWQGNGFYVGISWFLPMLVASRLVYTVICKLEKDNYFVKGIIVIIVSCAGVVIGNQGIKLPWSLDVAMATVFFMYLGDFAHRHQESVTAYLKKPWLILAALMTWAVTVYCFGYSELAIRSYPNGMTFLLVSSLSVSVVLGISYYVSCYMHHVTKALCVAGKYSFVILCAHVLDKSCLSYSSETNIFLLAAWELFLACTPVIVICLFHWAKKKMGKEERK